MTTLHDTLNDLEEKAKKATPGPWVTNEPASYNTYPGVYLVIGDRPNTDDEKIVINDDEATKDNLKYIAACSPDTVLALITALREAEEALKRIENPVLRGRPSYADWELRLIARDWLAKYAKREKG